MKAKLLILLLLVSVLVISPISYADSDFNVLPYDNPDVGGLGEQLKKYRGIYDLEKSDHAKLANVSLIKFQFSSDAELPVNTTYVIKITDVNYHGLNISITRLEQYYLFVVKSPVDEDRFIVDEIADLAFIVDEVKFVLVHRVVQHNVNFSEIMLELKGVKGAKGYIQIRLGEGAIIKEGFFPEEVPSPPIDPFGWLSFIGGIFGWAWGAFVFIWTLISKFFSIAWEVARFLFTILGKVWWFVEGYIIPNLPLFIGIYFVLTLATAIAMIPRKGVEALIWFAHLWYSHIMALVRFFKFLADMMWRLLTIILKIIDIITGPLT